MWSKLSLITKHLTNNTSKAHRSYLALFYSYFIYVFVQWETTMLFLFLFFFFFLFFSLSLSRMRLEVVAVSGLFQLIRLTTLNYLWFTFMYFSQIYINPSTQLHGHIASMGSHIKHTIHNTDVHKHTHTHRHIHVILITSHIIIDHNVWMVYHLR